MRAVRSFVLVLALPSSLLAQQSSTPTFYFAGGVELDRVHSGNPAGYRPEPGFSLQAGYNWQFRYLGLRVGLAYYARSSAYDLCGVDYPECDPSASYSHVSRIRTLALQVDATHDFFAVGVRPYLVGGLSLNRAAAWTRDVATGDMGGGYGQYGVALLPGVGLRVPVGPVEALSELRIHLVSGNSHVRMPLTFGMRF